MAEKTAKTNKKPATKAEPKVTKKVAKAEAVNETVVAPKYVAPKVEKSTDGSFAVIETGGKQYRVSTGDTIKIEKMKDKSYAEGDAITFDKVLLTDNGGDLTNIGTPYLDGAKVTGTLVEIGRAPKITVIKYKQKSRYFKKNGHRQPFFKVQIEKIS